MFDSEYLIHSADDFDAIEKRIAFLSNGENGRCSFLNSMEYKSLRLQALYNVEESMKELDIYTYNVHIKWTPGKITLYIGTKVVEEEPMGVDEFPDAKRQKLVDCEGSI